MVFKHLQKRGKHQEESCRRTLRNLFQKIEQQSFCAALWTFINPIVPTSGTTGLMQSRRFLEIRGSPAHMAIMRKH